MMPGTTEGDDWVNRLRTLDVDLEPSHCAETMHWAANEIERLRAVLTDIALDRGKCGPCGRLYDMPSNMTPLDCKEHWIKKCRWDSVDARERAQEALRHAE